MFSCCGTKSCISLLGSRLLSIGSDIYGGVLVIRDLGLGLHKESVWRACGVAVAPHSEARNPQP